MTIRRREKTLKLTDVGNKEYATSVILENDGLEFAGTVETDDGWAPALHAQEVENVSSKSFAVPAGEEWMLQSIWVELTSSADVGNRVVTVDLQDSAGDVIGRFISGVTQAASLARQYMFALGVENMTAFSGTYLSRNLPVTFLPAGFTVVVYDGGGIAPAADDMIVQVMVHAKSVAASA